MRSAVNLTAGPALRRQPGEPGDGPTPGPLRRHLIAVEAAAGLAFGYLVLHPVAMMVFRHLDRGGPPAHPGSGPSLAAALVESFHPHMLPMGLLFAALCGAMAAADGWSRATILGQRSHLTALVATLKERNQSLRQLSAANRRSTRFLIHDFKTHIGTILGFSSLLLDTQTAADDPEVRDGLIRIRRQAGKLNTAVTDLLELSRLHGGLPLRRRPLDLVSLLGQAADEFPAQKASGQIRIAGDPSSRTVEADPKLMRRVLVNLINNAFAHGAQTTTVELGVTEPPGDPNVVELYCGDDGPGIPEDQVTTVFDEFSSGSASSGLGLAFCKAAVEAHGGRIWCTGRAGRGTTFYFSLPAKGGTDGTDG